MIEIGTKIVEDAGGYGFNGYRFGEVVRETKTLWVTSLGTKYYKKDLSLQGGGYFTKMKLETQEHRLEHEKYVTKREISLLLSQLGDLRNKLSMKSSPMDLEVMLGQAKGLLDSVNKSIELES